MFENSHYFQHDPVLYFAATIGQQKIQFAVHGARRMFLRNTHTAGQLPVSSGTNSTPDGRKQQ